MFLQDQGNILTNLLSNGPWPPAIGEHLAIKRRLLPIAIGEFTGFAAGLPEDQNLEVKIYQRYQIDHGKSLLMWQDGDDNSYIIEKCCVLPVRPQLEVVPSLSRTTRSGRRITFQVHNWDVIQTLIEKPVSL